MSADHRHSPAALRWPRRSPPGLVHRAAGAERESRRDTITASRGPRVLEAAASPSRHHRPAVLGDAGAAASFTRPCPDCSPRIAVIAPAGIRARTPPRPRAPRRIAPPRAVRRRLRVPASRPRSSRPLRRRARSVAMVSSLPRRARAGARAGRQPGKNPAPRVDHMRKLLRRGGCSRTSRMRSPSSARAVRRSVGGDHLPDRG